MLYSNKILPLPPQFLQGESHEPFYLRNYFHIFNSFYLQAFPHKKVLSFSLSLSLLLPPSLKLIFQVSSKLSLPQGTPPNIHPIFFFVNHSQFR